jgi:hypothetical protein
MRRVLFGSLAACVLFVVSVTAAPKTEVQPTITLNVPETRAAAPVMWPALGDWVTFAVTFPKSVEHHGPRIQLMCYQQDVLVYGETAPYYQAFMLGGSSSVWLNDSPGPVHCVADLYYWTYQGRQKFNWLASTEFDAGGE